ncbi:hypothetical protein ANN_03119 [Periplaneta americana]|uniref:Uncharacterized protein n=1 Tax=Periplaneta americana TaxID=6978 RepID=A0ABQ8U316_PERAM|nr:hypothetical protein ANN_03119 [Periplaneta americana]
MQLSVEYEKRTIFHKQCSYITLMKFCNAFNDDYVSVRLNTIREEINTGMFFFLLVSKLNLATSYILFGNFEVTIVGNAATSRCYILFNDARNCRGYISVAGVPKFCSANVLLHATKSTAHLNAIDLVRDRTRKLSIVHGMVILLEQQCSFGKMFSGGGKEYIFQNVLVSSRIKPAIDAFYNARSIVRHPPLTRYAKASRSFTSVHIALVMSETILTIDTDRTFVITRDGCFVGENYISPIEIQSIGSEGKMVDSLCFPQYFHLRSPPAPNTAVPQPPDHSL